MAKKGRTKSSHQKQSTTRHKVAFAIGIVLIVFMVWTVLRSVSYISAVSDNAKKGMEMKELKGKGSSAPAFGKKGRLCKAEGFAAFFSFCKIGSKGRGNTCTDGCTCEPFMKKGKWGVCKTGEGGGPGPGKPTATPVPGGGSNMCGATCTQDADCESEYCHPAGFPLCPTAEPGQPIEDCQFIPPDPTQPNVCMPVDCKTNAEMCRCPNAQQVAPNKFNIKLK